MNSRMLKTELYKIYSKKVVWISMLTFLAFYLLLRVQFIDNVGVKYNLEPMRSELTEAVSSEVFREFVQSRSYGRYILGKQANGIVLG